MRPTSRAVSYLATFATGFVAGALALGQAVKDDLDVLGHLNRDCGRLGHDWEIIDLSIGPGGELVSIEERCLRCEATHRGFAKRKHQPDEHRA